MTSTRTLPVIAVLLAAAAGLSACAAGPGGKATPNPALQVANPGALFPLKVEEAKDQIALAIHADGLSTAQGEALKALAGRRSEARGGVVTVSLPEGADAAVAGRMDGAIEATLGQLGVPVTRAAYRTEDAKAPILVSYAYDKADIPACGKHWQDLTKTKDNTVQSNFGCAVNANMAAMIANPSDIRAPRAEDGASAERRVTVLEKYEAGKPTGAESAQGQPSIAHIGQ
jgi:pilus assembly protein CpaD